MELLNTFKAMILEILIHYGVDEKYADYGYVGLILLAILSIAWTTNLIVKKFLVEIFRTLAKKTKTSLAKHLLEERFFLRLSHLAPAFIIASLSSLFFASYPTIEGLIAIMINLYLVVILLWVVDAVIDALYKVYEESSLASKLPLKGICQAIKIVVNATGIIFILSILLDKSPLYFFSGLGALTAVLLLVFKRCHSWFGGGGATNRK